MEVKAVLFDVDGVINKSEMFSIQYQKEYGLEPDEMLPFFKGVFQDCLVGKADLQKVIKPYLKQWKWKGSVSGFLDYWFEAERSIDTDIVDLIKAMSQNGILTYIATNQEKYRTQFIWNEMGCKEYFDGIFSSSDLGCLKEEDEFFEKVLRRFKSEQVNPGSIVYVDDGAENIESAKRCGIEKSYLFEDNTSLKQTLEAGGLI